MEKKCVRCKTKITVSNNKQKYCKDCAYIVDLEKSKKTAREKRQKVDGTFGPNAIKNKDGSINFKAEKIAIKKEFKRLGLRK